MLVKLVYENKKLKREQQDNEAALLDIERKTEAKSREFTMDEKNLELSMEQLQDLKIKNQQIQKQNEEIEGRI